MVCRGLKQKVETSAGLMPSRLAFDDKRSSFRHNSLQKSDSGLQSRVPDTSRQQTDENERVSIERQITGQNRGVYGPQILNYTSYYELMLEEMNCIDHKPAR